MSGDAAREIEKQGQVMNSFVCHVAELGLYSVHNEKPSKGFLNRGTRSIYISAS